MAKKSKKILALVLALVICLGLLGVGALAEGDESDVYVKEYHLMTREDFQNYCWDRAGKEVNSGHWVTALVLNGIKIIAEDGAQTARQADITGGDGYNVYGNVEFSGLTRYIQPDEVKEIVLYGTYADNYMYNGLLFDIPLFTARSFEYHISADEFVFDSHDDNWNTQEFCEVYFKDKAPQPEAIYSATLKFTYGLEGNTPAAVPDGTIQDIPLDASGVYTISYAESMIPSDWGSYSKEFTAIPDEITIGGTVYKLEENTSKTITLSTTGGEYTFHYSASSGTGATEPVNFYVSLDGTVYDYLDENGDQVISAHPTAQFSGSVGTSTVTGKDHSYGLVGKMNAVDATDGAIRALAPDTIAAIPADEATFAALRADTKMQDYCTANGIDISSVTDANYDLYWYVLKYDESDGWHVDGVLVKEGEAPGYAVEYTVKHEYYTDNSLSGSTQSTAIGKVGDVITAESIAKVTSYNGNTYTYTSASAASITLAVDAASNTITLRYDRTTGGSVTPPPVGPSTYTLTVNYVDDEGNTIQDSTTTTYTAGVPYTVTAPAIEGYTYSHAEGDALSGYMSQDRVVTLVYTAGDMDIDDGDVPLDPGPGDGDGDGEIDIDDGDVPLDPGPGGDGDGEIDIDDGEVPLDGAPQTGDSAPLLVLAALLAISGGAVLTLSMTGKKKESTEK